MCTVLTPCVLTAVVALLCCSSTSAGPALDPKFLMELASQFDPSMLTASCRKLFQKCKPRIIPLVLQFEQLIQKVPDILGVECVNRELAKGFPRFDIECVMSDDYKEGIDCMDDPKLKEVLGPKTSKSLQPVTACFRDVPPAV
ncbi:uncharacterized protein LOC144107145 [Amblyomma americanum]